MNQDQQQQQAQVVSIQMDTNVLSMVCTALDFLPSANASNIKMPASLVGGIMQNFNQQAKAQLDAQQAAADAAEAAKKLAPALGAVDATANGNAEATDKSSSDSVEVAKDGANIDPTVNTGALAVEEASAPNQ